MRKREGEGGGRGRGERDGEPIQGHFTKAIHIAHDVSIYLCCGVENFRAMSLVLQRTAAKPPDHSKGIQACSGREGER